MAPQFTITVMKTMTPMAMSNVMRDGRLCV
ncbi:MAG: hypothetical protein QOJ96_641 [Alphaproteobacteria bacterium]|jgi:hypothetical protein|nr:hypothetical protein [Alphaproteobacteria bacterium]